MTDSKNIIYGTSKSKNSHIVTAFSFSFVYFFNIWIRNVCVTALAGGRATGSLFRHDFDNHCDCNADNKPSSWVARRCKIAPGIRCIHRLQRHASLLWTASTVWWNLPAISNTTLKWILNTSFTRDLQDSWERSGMVCEINVLIILWMSTLRKTQ